MRYPKLYTREVTRTVTDTFGGYDHRLSAPEGAFYDMKNLTSDHYPILSPRKRRGVYAVPEAVGGLIGKDKLCYVDGSRFVVNGYPVEMGLSETKAEEPKQLVSMGAYVVILPDRKYINTADLTDYGSIDAEFETVGTVSFRLCRADGEAVEPAFLQATEPEEPESGALWMDTSAVPHSLKQWSGSSGMWAAVTATYIKISSPGIGRAFGQYDGVKLSGLSGELTDADSGEAFTDSQLAALEGSAVVWEKGDDYILVTGILDRVRSITNPVKLARRMPVMDFVTEAGNRLWGCRYGVNDAGEIVNEIYASKLGDLKNWNCFMGLSTDSYAVSVGSDGAFTGAVTHLGEALFFKETCVHRLYGSYPANFRLQTTLCRGVQPGCGRSLAIVGETLYYKSRDGVCAFDGSLPVDISENLGKERCGSAVAGSWGSKYYLSMKGSDGTYSLFVFDSARGLWHREDDLQAADFCFCGGELYCTDARTGKILALGGSGEAETEPVRWMAETGLMGTGLPDAKYVTGLGLRMALEPGAAVRIFVEYDSCGRWERLGVFRGTRLGSVTVPLRPRRCDHLRLRIEGTGDGKLYAITKTYEQGSDRF